MPIGAIAWTEPGGGGKRGWFEAGTPVDITQRVGGPYGWDWLEVRGRVVQGRTVDAYVRADLVASTTLAPQRGVRCAMAYNSAEYGDTPIYSIEIMKIMTRLRDLHEDLIIARVHPNSVFAVYGSIRARYGWEWHTVSLTDGRRGVIRADHLRPAPAVQQGSNWKCIEK